MTVNNISLCFAANVYNSKLIFGDERNDNSIAKNLKKLSTYIIRTAQKYTKVDRIK